MVTCSPVVDGGRWKEGQAEEELLLLARRTLSPSSRTLVYDVETGSLRYSKPCRLLKSTSPRTLKALESNDHLDVVDSLNSTTKQLHCEGFPESSGESSPTCVIQNSALRSNSSSPTMSTISKASSVDPGRRSTGTKPLGVVATDLDSEQEISNSPGAKSPRLEPHKVHLQLQIGEVRERIKKLESINNTSGRPGLTGPRVEIEFSVPKENVGWPSSMPHDQVKDSTLNPPFKSRQCAVADSKKWKHGRLADSSVIHCKSPGIFSFNATYMMPTSRAPDSDLDCDFHDQIHGDTTTPTTGSSITVPKVIVQQQDLSRRTFLPPLLKPTPSKWDDAEKWLPGSECQSARSKSRSGPLLAQMVAAQAGMSIPWKGPQIVLSSQTERHHTSGMVVGLQQRGEAMEVDSGSESVDIKDVQTPITVTTRAHNNPGLEEFTADEKEQLNLLLDRYSGESVRSGDGTISPSCFNGSFLKLGARTEKPPTVVEFSPPQEEEYKSVDLDEKTNNFTPRVAVATRDMGTAMTPTASVEPSRTSTPVRATKNRPHENHPVQVSNGDNDDHAAATTTEPAPAEASPNRVVMSDKEMQEKTRQEIVSLSTQLGKANIAAAWAARDVQQEKEEEEDSRCAIVQRRSSSAVLDLDNLRRDLFASRAHAWQEAEKAKYTSRFEQEQAKIQAWEEHEKAKADAEMRRVELKVERMKSQAHEKLAHKLASTRRQAEELRLAAETRRADAAAKASRKAEILKTNGKITNLLFLSYLCT